MAAMASAVREHDDKPVVLIASDARGEGAFTVEMALGSARPAGCHVVRASKFLASSDWLGRDYKAAFETNDELFAALQKDRITWLVLDRSVPGKKAPPHLAQLSAALADEVGGPYQRVLSLPMLRGASSGTPSTVELYRRRESTPAK